MIDLVRMVNPKGFIEEFYKELKEARKEEPAISQREVYERLEDAFWAMYECNRFPSYDAFRQFLSREYRKRK